MSKKEKISIHGEISYGDVHSDICPAGCDHSNLDESWIRHAHRSLDEWIHRANGRGYFFLGEEGFWVADVEISTLAEKLVLVLETEKKRKELIDELKNLLGKFA